MNAPKDIRPESDGLHILWDDGHSSFYPHRFLRGVCPCAECVEEMSGRRRVFAKDVPEDIQALDWMPVGRYAIQFLWSDAHYTGLYPFTLLRAICQCPLCSSQKGSGAASQNH